MIFQIILTFHIIIAIALVAIILMQQGKGANAGPAFGSGSQSLFGASGGRSFLYKFTRALAIGFFATSITLAYLASSDVNQENTQIDSIVNASDIPDVPATEPVVNKEGIPE